MLSWTPLIINVYLQWVDKVSSKLCSFGYEILDELNSEELNLMDLS